MAPDTSEIKGIRPEAVTEWFRTHIPGAQPPLSFALIPGGRSNLTYRVTDAVGALYVLRRPPLGAVLATAHDMAREHRIISALGKTDVPVPPALGLCEDDSINDAPFYVMSFVTGMVLNDARQTREHFDEGERRRIGESVIEVLAKLHSVDPDEVGLGQLGRREGYLERQLKRWRTQWENSKTRELPAMEEAYERLLSDVPPQIGATIVHGDYRLGNMLTGDDARIAAVLDWELCTLGDPLADLGYLLNNWAEPGENGPTNRGAALSPTASGGFPSREETVERYTALTGRDVTSIDYYRAFQYWRLAAIVEGVLARYLKGVMGDSGGDTSVSRHQVEALASSALDLVRSTGR